MLLVRFPFAWSAPGPSAPFSARPRPVSGPTVPSEGGPTIGIGLPADTLHCLLLGSIRLSKAVGSDLLDMKGPVWKTLALGDVFHSAQQLYPAILEAHNLPTTCPETTRA